MSSAPKSEIAAEFEALRPRLTRIAYRMLGSVADAEDVVQEAFIRWPAADRDSVRAPEAFLSRVVTRLCFDAMKSACMRRETYVGPWLPEPIVEADEDEIDDITLPLMMALERLSPLERAAFLLHDVFGASFAEVGETIGRSAAACRQLASRARAHVRVARPVHPVTKEKGMEMAAAFFAASRNGDMDGLRAMLSADVVIHADGGGRRPAAPAPIVGIENAIGAHAALARIFARHMSRLVRYGLIDGLPGFVTIEADTLQTTAVQIEEGKIAAIYVVRSPDKLTHLRRLVTH
jgi:RNA polymerase sigma-70 factor (ECF subfamily)